MPERTRYLTESDRLLKAGHWPEQMSLLEKAVVACPDEPEFWYRYAVGCAESDPERCAEHARRAADLAGDDPGLLARAANLMYDIQDYEASERDRRRAIARMLEGFPLTPDMLHLAGKLALQKGNEAVAEEYLGHAFEIEPGSPGFGRILAVRLTERGDHQGGLDVINRALAHDPSDKDLLLGLRNEISASL